MRCPNRGGLPVGPPQACPIPEPFVLDDTVLGTTEMEQFESALVRIVDVTLPRKFGRECYEGYAGPGCTGMGGSNCDLDGDGDVNLDPGLEDACNDDCAADVECSEWNQFIEFGQFAVQTAGGTINVVTREAISDFDPAALAGAHFDSITGTLRNFSPLGPQRGYILEPRCDDDLVQMGPPVPAASACVFPRTGGPDDPM